MCVYYIYIHTYDIFVFVVDIWHTYSCVCVWDIYVPSWSVGIGRQESQYNLREEGSSNLSALRNSRAGALVHDPGLREGARDVLPFLLYSFLLFFSLWDVSVPSFLKLTHVCRDSTNVSGGASDQATGVLSELTSLMSSSVHLAFVAGGAERMPADGVVKEYIAETLKSLHNHQERWRIVLTMSGGMTGILGR